MSSDGKELKFASRATPGQEQGTISSFLMRERRTSRIWDRIVNLCYFPPVKHCPPATIHSILRWPGPGQDYGTHPPNLNGHTSARDAIQMPLKVVPRSAPRTEKVNRYDRPSKGVNLDRA
jgi:hypothetical protein